MNVYRDLIFSWEPALGLANSRDADEVKKNTIDIFNYKQRLLFSKF